MGRQVDENALYKILEGEKILKICGNYADGVRSTIKSLSGLLETAVVNLVPSGERVVKWIKKAKLVTAVVVCDAGLVVWFPESFTIAALERNRLFFRSDGPSHRDRKPAEERIPGYVEELRSN